MLIKPKLFQKNVQFLSRNQFDEHILLYKKYVDKTNNLTRILPVPLSEYYSFKTQQASNINGVILHELYFENIEKSVNMRQAPVLEELMNDCFESFSRWWDDFERCAGISKGWVIFGYEPLTQTYQNIILSAHDAGNLIGFKPLLVLDCYEHAYFMDYGTDKTRYVYDFMTNINWKLVEKRLKSL